MLPLLGRLEAAGFRLEYGEDGTGWPLKFRTRGGGYYFNVGASELIADGRIKLIQAADIEAYVTDGIRMRDGTTRKADLFVLATGYKGPDHLLTRLFGAGVAKRVGRVWGFDEGDAGASQHVDAHVAAGAVVHRRRILAGANLQQVHRRADRCDRGGAAGEGGVRGRPFALYPRHCEPTGRANARPMTGSAKQSTLPRKERMDCVAALAMTRR